jgi:hypothetical protein
MASTLALGPACLAVLTMLRVNPGVAFLVPPTRIVDDVTPRPTYPYVLVEGSEERPVNTLGPPNLPKWGGSARVNVRVVSQSRGDQEAFTILDAIKRALDGQPITVAGYQSAGISFEHVTVLKDTVNGVTTRELVAEFDVTVHQS